MTQIIDRTDPAELEALRKMYQRRTLVNLRDLTQRLQVQPEGTTKAAHIDAILKTSAKLVHTTPPTP